MVGTTDSEALLEGVDRAALVLAVVAGAVTITGTDGEWGAYNVFVGLLLLTMVTGFHRPVSTVRTVRTVLMRVAFGFGLSLALFIALAWPIQEIFPGEPCFYGDPRFDGELCFDAPTSTQSVAAFVAVGILLAYLEPPIARLLSKQLSSKWLP